ncbi:hypothetical protein [Paraliomyxa miuraensis]|uniref:hypothetical protein n=1 Tax=Paraliomyxa miuraensis TaxID=376150 RepID=UPI002257D8B1|nr:hypothetical protein [Paraliomyxa miuraensis]MCX4245207.1 hypothetical protein [Paraliomyxa miuraensis]
MIGTACGEEPPPEDPPASTGLTAFGDSGTSTGADEAPPVETSPTSTSSTTTGDAEDSSGADEVSSGDPPSTDPCDGADILCDDFEDPALDPQWVYTGAPGNMPVIDEGRAFAGTRSLTFPTTDTQGAFVYPAAGLPVAGDRIYVRAYVNFEREMSAMGGHVSYIVGANAPSNGAELRLGASQNFGNGQMMVDVNLLGNGPEYTQFSNGDVTGGAPSGAPGVTLVADTWYCIEALYDGSAHEFRLWIDGMELSAMHVTDWQMGVTNWSPVYSVVKIGGQNYSGSLGQIWFDDVAMGTQPLGCP